MLRYFGATDSSMEAMSISNSYTCLLKQTNKIQMILFIYRSLAEFTTSLLTYQALV